MGENQGFILNTPLRMILILIVVDIVILGINTFMYYGQVNSLERFIFNGVYPSSEEFSKIDYTVVSEDDMFTEIHVESNFNLILLDALLGQREGFLFENNYIIGKVN